MCVCVCVLKWLDVDDDEGDGGEVDTNEGGKKDETENV